ncbi:MAG: glycosyltransferase family 2 protein [Cyanothece sp. SIO1E1]|nr:glycosyltransferase family 2 protein [Cyanothece sp. SIO1E1]
MNHSINKNPTVSVSMAVYNAEQFVAETVESILAQTFIDFEFIIIDDGSTDRSLKILETYAVKDKRIRLISRQNKGISRTRNEMLSQAKGEFIAVMDADDIALPERLAHQVEFLQREPNIVCVSSAYKVIDARGRLLTCLTPPEHNDEIQKFILAGHAAVWHPCAMFRRTAAMEVGGYEEAMPSAHDLDLWLKLGEVGQLQNLQEILLKYRLHNNSISEQLGLRQRKEAREACERAWKRRGIEGHFEASKPWRPTKERHSQYYFMLKYGWWAFNNGQRQTAMLYGRRAIASLPFNLKGWKLLACATFKQLPNNGIKTPVVKHAR